MRRLVRRAPSICGWFAVVGGSIVLAGWWSGLPRWASVVPGLPPMVPNSALMAILLGASLLLSASNAPKAASRGSAMVGKGCAGLAGAIAAVTLVEYVFGLDLEIDQLLAVTQAAPAVVHPGRPSPQTATACLLAAAALLSVHARSARGRRSAELLALASGLISMTALLGYLFGAAVLYGYPSLLPHVGVSIPTALVLLALSSGIVASGIDVGVLSILTKEDSGGATARHLAAWIAAFVPMVCAIAIGARLGFYTPPFASALVVLSGAVAGSAFVLRASWRLSRLDAKRREAEEMLQHAHARIELALQGADLATWDWNIESGEVIFNSRWAEMRGFHFDEIRPHVDSWTSGIHPEDWPRVQQVLDDYFQGRIAAYETEHRVRTKSGSWIWVLDRGKVFARDERGQPIRMAGTELDITARKRLEHELRLLEAKSSGILSISADAIISIDDGQRITMFNEGAEKVFGYAAKEAIGASLEILIPERFRAAHREHVARFARGSEVSRSMGERGAELFGLRKNGDEFYADAAISKLDVDGKRVLTVAVRDVSERRRSELENARLCAEAQRAAQTRDDVVGIVAHDLRNPLGTILIQTDLLRRLGAEPGSRAHRAAEVIERSARRMNRLVQDLLEVTRMEAGQLPVERARVAAGELVDDSVAAQQPLAAAASLELRADVARDLSDVWADRDRLQQVFENLVGNAVKFTPRGGTIVVGATPRAGEVLFWVADTGAGIASGDLPHVFERFWQARRPGRRGAGLGLPIVKGIVEAHDGRIWVESTPGRGSTFFFTIPSAPRAEEQLALHAP